VISADRPKDRNQALFHVNFLFDALRKFIMRRRPDRITGIIDEELRSGPSLIRPLQALVERDFIYGTDNQYVEMLREDWRADFWMSELAQLYLR
jgi:hypothetical protein